MKKILYIIGLLMILGYFIVITGFVNNQANKAICSSIKINIRNDHINKFITEKEILSIIEQNQISLKGQKLNEINTFLIEKILNFHPVVRKSSVYKSIDGILYIEIEQKQPIVRIIDKHLQQYFIDELGNIIPNRHHQVSHVLVANGNINPITYSKKIMNIIKTNKDSITVDQTIYNIFQIAKYIYFNDFWRSQIEQIYVTDKKDILLIPRIGNHIINFGDHTDIHEKFVKLSSMYRAMNQIGWNQYKIINLKYKNQVVCIKQN